MPDCCYACHENFLREYLIKISSATPQQLEYAQSRYTQIVEGKPLSIWDQEGDIAFINIRGLLTDRPSYLGLLFGYSFTTYEALLTAIKEVKENPEVNRVALRIDSGGGYATPGLDDSWQALRDLADSKELIAINQGMMASGAYWLASAAPRIVSVSKLTEQGSIGVYASFYDWTEYDKREGIKEVRVVSKNAPLKNLPTDDERLVKQIRERLDNVENIFLSRISEGRKHTADYIAENFGKGAILTNEKALSVGMIDEVTTFDKVFVSAGNNASVAQITQTQEDRMPKSLEELLAENPDLSAHIDGIRKEAFDSGAKSTQQEKEAVTFATNILTSETYSPFVKQIAANVMAGSTSVAELRGAVTYEDQLLASKEMKDTQQESASLPETPAMKPSTSSLNEDGTLSNMDDLKAEADRIRNR